MSNDVEVVVEPVVQVPAHAELANQLMLGGSQQPVRSASTEIAIEEGKAAIAIKVLAAQRIGRNMAAIDQQMTQLCQDPTFADKALYTLKGKGTGPSARFAEAVATLWGNLETGYVEYSHENNQSVVEARCWDMVTNNVKYQRIIVKHAIYSNDGGLRIQQDPATIRQIVNRETSKAQRNVTLANVLAHYRAKWIDLCIETNRSVKDLKPRTDKAFEQFRTRYGISQEQIEHYLGTKRERIGPDEFQTLLGVWNAIKDGDAQITDFFPSKDDVKKAELAKPETKAVITATANAEANARARELGVQAQGQPATPRAVETPTSSETAPEQKAEAAASVSAAEGSAGDTSPSALPPAEDMNRPVTTDEVKKFEAWAQGFGWTPGALKFQTQCPLTKLTVSGLEDLRAHVEQNPKSK